MKYSSLFASASDVWRVAIVLEVRYMQRAPLGVSRVAWFNA